MPEAAPTPQRVTAPLLGPGTSPGIPVIGCNCRVCTSSDPREQRLRCSAHIVAETEAGPVHLQIDTGPDFRTQALRFGVEAVDALLVPHAQALQEEESNRCRRTEPEEEAVLQVQAVRLAKEEESWVRSGHPLHQSARLSEHQPEAAEACQ